MQNEEAAECRFFRKAVLGSEAHSAGSLQGTYVFAPSGKLLARRNSNSPEAIAKTLREGWAKWQKLDDSDRKLANPDALDEGFRFEQLFPTTGLVLRRTARDLPGPGVDKSQAGERFNRDSVWLSSEEASDLLPEKLTQGARQQWPAALAKRLSCLVFVDNVRGQTIPYHSSEDHESALWSEVTGSRDGLISLRITGKTAAVAKGPWLFKGETVWEPAGNQQSAHSIETHVLGSATFDATSKRFVSFDLLALGTRRGRTVNNGRATTEPSGVGFVCKLAPKGWRIPPTFIDTYNVDWALAPK